ncbi:CLIP domain-containing serine protease B8-like [Wyeomyia smithii]|uniref:CLIP domain-containing serine protease B8-like n=1 Tax=Wyeomyia smithii TaxID=174621 RepID=UPI002467DC7C|nr:CLIP domain-containing serine protease B8-like [Wyeomyia smithii]
MPNAITGLFLLLPTVVVTFTSLPCEIPNESTTGYCIAPDNCHAYQKLKSGALAATPETKAFLKQLRCSSSTICCTMKQAYGNPRVGVLPSGYFSDLAENCGVEDNRERIIGGEATDIDEFPWLVLLFYHSNVVDKTVPACGGVLISKRWVLTAAHCVTGRSYRNMGVLEFVRVGENNLETEVDCNKNNDCADRSLDITVEKIVPHPEYVSTSWNKYNDIALLKLTEDAPYTDFVRYICLPNYYNLTQVNTNIFVAAGWGQTDFYKTIDTIPSKVKLKVSLPHMELSRCQSVYEQFSIRVADSQICAGGRKSQDTCRGDSGSPLMYFNPSYKRWFAYGIVSRGPAHCGTEGVPSIYTSLFEFDDWVSSTMKAN